MRRAAALLLCAPLAAPGCMSDEPVERPAPLYAQPPFEYPVELWDKKLEGETILLIHVTADGSVDSVAVYRSSGHPQFDSAALAGARQLRFIPGRQGGRRVNMWAKLPVRFSRDRAATPGRPEDLP